MTSNVEMSSPVTLPPAPAQRDGASAWDRVALLRVPSLAAALLIAALWLISRPYRGVRHDGILYLGQTLAHTLPDTIGRDVFLGYGSQDRYSIFSVLMSPLVQALGVPLSQLGMLVLCQVAFALGCWALTAELPSRFVRWCAMLSLAALSHTYTGGGGAFAFAEPFLSARSLAEPLVLLSLALLLRGRTAWAVLPMLGALALHALVTVPALVAAWVFLCLQDRRWCFAAVVALGAAGLGALGIAPLDGLWHAYDPLWWTNVHIANANVFIQTTRTQDWGTAALDALVLLTASHVLRGTPLARLLRALLICAPVLTAVWALGADVFHNVLLTQLQVWRIYWLTHLFTVLLLPLLLLHFWERGPIGRWAVAALVLAATAVSANLSTELLCLAWALLPMFLSWRDAQISPALARLAAIVSCVAVLIVSAIVGFRTHSAVAMFPERFNGATDVQIVLGLSAVGAAIGYALMRGLAAAGAWRWVSGVVLLALLACGGAWWDQRSDWQRYVENGLHGSGLPFEGVVPPSATVLWDDSLIEPWLLMQRQQFFASEQGAGLLFSRPTAMEFAVHENAIRPMLVQRQVCKTVAVFTGTGDVNCYPTPEILREICQQEPRHPDYMVFRALPDSDGTGAVAIWNYRPGDPVHSRSYRLYDCARMH